MSAPNYSETSQTGHDSQPASWGTWVESHEGLECLKCPEPHVCPVSPVSKGQEVEKELGGLAVGNACTRVGDDAESKFFKFARDVRGLA
jgi:hypothetical protein